MKSKSKKKIALLLSGSMLLNAGIIFSSSAADEPIHKKNDKSVSDNIKYHVMVWMNDIDYSEVTTAAEQSLGFSWDDIEQFEKESYEAAKKRNNSKGITLDTEYELYDKQLVAELQTCSEMTNALISEERSISRSLYEVNNQAVIDSEALSSEIDYISKYSPSFIASLSSDQICSLKKNEKIVSIYPINNIEYKPLDDNVTESPPKQISATDYLSYINATVPKSNGFDGSGIKVGMLDWAIVSSSSHSELSSSNIVGVGTSSNLFPTHARNVARIICGSNGVAPNCTLYSAGFTSGNFADYQNKMELLIACGVNIINCSFGADRNTSISDYYAADEIWTDHIAANHHVTVIIAAGNDNADTTPITTPGLSYNPITVGNADYATNTMCSSSRYLYNGGVRKPDVVAPGEEVLGFSGTSASTACVSGMTALLMQKKNSIKGTPVAVKAVILAGCGSYAGGGSPTSGYNTKQGAGLVNCQNSFDILSAGNYYVNYITSNGTFTYNISYSSPGLHTAAFAGLKVNTETSGGGITVHNMPNTAFVFDNGLGTALASDIAGNASARIVRYGSGANTYTLKLTVTSIPSPGLLYAFAWR